ncbi:MAG TPA: DUF692 domain-containing protein [Methylomirabilota bacterium]|nr:DUF692 domain-containing protein [Methylomirabilota bacterium]
MISGCGVTGAGLVGIGLRAPHVAEIVATRPPIGWVEVHTENYLGGGPTPRALDRIRREHPVSLHGVGLSLGSAEGLERAHLARVVDLVRRIEPVLVSEHLSWSIVGGAYLNHLLPLPYTEESLALIAGHVTEVQDALGRPVLVENPSSYLRFHHSPIPEPEFLAELARRTGCSLLCDVNNVFVSCRNFDQDPAAYLDALPAPAIGEIHLAGHARNEAEGRTILIDDHGSPVSDEVWALYARALERFGPRPTLIEWDTDIPALPVLLDEARRAEAAIAGSVTGEGARALAA